LVQNLIAVVPQPPAAANGYAAATQNDQRNNDNDKRSIVLFWFFERGSSHIFFHFLFSCLLLINEWDGNAHCHHSCDGKTSAYPDSDIGISHDESGSSHAITTQLAHAALDLILCHVAGDNGSNGC